MISMSSRVVQRSAAWGQEGQEPLLSIVVPVFNTETYLAECLNSLVPHDPSLIEIIVVHDGGSDGSLAIADQWVLSCPPMLRACLIDQENAGLSAARNEGLRHARGEFVAFMDSDDIANSEVLCSAARDAKTYSCDVVLFRGCVLEGLMLEAHYFYDSWVWDEIMRGRSFAITRLSECPRLLRLEPNANVRVIRRALFENHEIEFPLGLHFEDMLAHVQQFLADRTIGLRNEIGYLYRINRPGKITDQKSNRRFDAIRTVGLAVKAAEAGNLSDDAWANFILQAIRLLSWCAGHTTNADRLQFCTEAVGVMKDVPRAYFRLAKRRWSGDPDVNAILALFRDGDARGLQAQTSGKFMLSYFLKKLIGKRAQSLRGSLDKLRKLSTVLLAPAGAAK